MTYEYQGFGIAVMRREAGSADDWEQVPPEDEQDALIELGVAQRMRAENAARGPQSSVRIFANAEEAEAAGVEVPEAAPRMFEKGERPPHEAIEISDDDTP